jgi:cation transport ATPase
MFSESMRRSALVVLPAFGLAAGFACPLIGQTAWQAWIWTAFTIPVLLTLVFSIFVSLRKGEVGLDIVAALSMTAALVVGKNLAAIVVALIYSGGQFLETFAERHARRELTAILARVPGTAVRYRNGTLEAIGLDAILPGDRLLIRQGDTVPVDGTVATGQRFWINQHLPASPFLCSLSPAKLS